MWHTCWILLTKVKVKGVKIELKVNRIRFFILSVSVMLLFLCRALCSEVHQREDAMQQRHHLGGVGDDRGLPSVLGHGRGSRPVPHQLQQLQLVLPAAGRPLWDALQRHCFSFFWQVQQPQEPASQDYHRYCVCVWLFVWRKKQHLISFYFVTLL